ncbi:hypothetical protein PCH_Pc20g11830 [Penicillium rubens Wisconsin 54-1255]|uniref:Uncharacterized protein n=1 Tax=Penicillium rubens (strain ATCC 28089 / DSM 1075 / NRRL 1951 / Wisconsin 54-1255) TaxID=500485 RepID=B6HGB7_PENRW|nr:hypothetical protein PCH_Pc20g11830 [Penicillium rubens Wisconsin 54-1255]
MGPAILDQYHDDFGMEVKASRSAWALTVRFSEPTSSRITCYPPLLVEWARDGPLPTVHCLLFKFQYFRQATGYTIEDAVSESYRKLRADADWWDKKGMFAFETIILDPTLRLLSQQRRSYKTIPPRKITMSQSMFL